MVFSADESSEEGMQKRTSDSKVESTELSADESSGEEIQKRTSYRKKARAEKGEPSAGRVRTDKSTSTKIPGGQEMQRRASDRIKAQVEKRASAGRTQTQKSTSAGIPRGQEILGKTSDRRKVRKKERLEEEVSAGRLLPGKSSSSKILVQRRTSDRRQARAGKAQTEETAIPGGQEIQRETSGKSKVRSKTQVEEEISDGIEVSGGILRPWYNSSDPRKFKPSFFPKLDLKEFPYTLEEPGSDKYPVSKEYEYVEPDRVKVLEEIDQLAMKNKIESEKNFKDLETLLRRWTGQDQNYHDVLQKVLNKEITEKRIIERIARYFEYNLRKLKGCLARLKRVREWDVDIADRIARYIKQATNHFEVEVEELRELSTLVEDYHFGLEKRLSQNTLNSKLKYMRRYLGAWVHYNSTIDKTKPDIKGTEKWIETPTSSFRSFLDDEAFMSWKFN